DPDAGVPGDVRDRVERVERVGDEEVVDHRQALAAEDLDLARVAGAGPHDDVGAAVGVDVAHGDVEPVAGVGIECEEAGDWGHIRAIEHDDSRAATGPGAGGDVRLAVPGDAPGRDVHPTAERRLVDQHVSQYGERLAAQDADPGSTADPGPGDDVGTPVPVEVRRRHVHPAPERGLVGQEGVDQ